MLVLSLTLAECSWRKDRFATFSALLLFQDSAAHSCQIV